MTAVQTTREALARNLRVLRAERGLQIIEVEEGSGVDRNTIAALEAGTRGAYSVTLERLAAFYGVTPAQLLGSTPPLSAGGRREDRMDYPFPPAPEAHPAYRQWRRERESRLTWKPMEDWLEMIHDEPDLNKASEDLFERMVSEQKMEQDLIGAVAGAWWGDLTREQRATDEAGRMLQVFQRSMDAERNNAYTDKVERFRRLEDRRIEKAVEQADVELADVRLTNDETAEALGGG